MTARPRPVTLIHVVLSKGIMFVEWGAEEVTEENAMTVLAEVCELSAGEAYPLIFELHGIRTVSYRARKALAAGPWPATRVAIVANAIVDQTAAYFFLGRHPTPCDSRMFVSLPEAMTWVRSCSVP